MVNETELALPGGWKLLCVCFRSQILLLSTYRVLASKTLGALADNLQRDDTGHRCSRCTGEVALLITCAQTLKANVM
jgi:hypothetical protein